MAKAVFRRLRIDQLNEPRPALRKGRTQVEALAKSIAEVGLLVPLVVRGIGGEEYVVIAGAGRLEALRLNGAGASTKVPCVVVEASDAEATLMALVENTAREGLTPLEEAEAAAVLVREYGYTQEAVAAATGRTQARVSQWLKVLSLDARVAAALRSGKIEMATASALLPLAGDAAAQRELLEQVLKRGLGAAQARALVSKRLHGAAAIEPVRYTVAGAGKVEARTTRSGKLSVSLQAEHKAGLDRLLRSLRKRLKLPKV
jgi:ParB family chromosome partitioning protein